MKTQRTKENKYGKIVSECTINASTAVELVMLADDDDVSTEPKLLFFFLQ